MNYFQFIKNLILVTFFISLFACSSTEKISKYKNEVPKWYLETKDQSKRKFYGKALGESSNLDIAIRKAQTLAISDALFKIKAEAQGLRTSYIKERYSKNNKKVKSTATQSYEDKIEIAIKNFEIKEYKVSKKKIFRTKNNYKAFVKIEVKKSNIYSELDKID
ncbi:MAG: LPP20 family lipoprotein [Pelagibacteraceae bacterium]